MNIRWNNVIVALLLVTVLVLGIHFWEPISQFLGSMRGIGGPPRGDDRVIGMVALGIVGAITLAILKILINNNRNNNP